MAHIDTSSKRFGDLGHIIISDFQRAERLGKAAFRATGLQENIRLPDWLAAAVQLLLEAGLSGAAGLLARRGDEPMGPRALGDGAGPGGHFVDGVFIPPHPHRRRRKALTDSDLRTMHEIATSIGKKAAETFIAQRVRRS